MANKPSNLTREKIRYGVLAGLLTMLVAAYVMIPDVAWAKGKKDFVLKTSKNDFATTVENLKKGVAAQKLVLLKDYNVQMMVKMVGVKADEAVTFAIFHPRYGKVLYEDDPDAFAVTPLRIIVQQRGKKVVVGYVKPSAIYAPFDVPKKTTKELDDLFAEIVSTLVE